MPDYDFRQLSPVEFEALVRDLLQALHDVEYESFATGRDSGIDLRYSCDPEGQTIVQCKHYVRSGYSKLLSKLKSTELEKVTALSPKRYILATSVSLSPGNKDELVALFEPYVHSTADVLGQEDLNNLLGLFPDVEKRHYKLWIASTSVLERVMKSGLIGRSELLVEQIVAKAAYFVQVSEFAKALNLLNEHHYCLILGPAGIGKTTLADMLCVHHLNEGYELVQVSRDIQEGFELRDAARKQVFYYDDFLGQAAIEEQLTKNEETRLSQFIEAVKSNPRHRFIMTSREYLLPQAEATYPRLRAAHLQESLCQVTLSGLDPIVRAQMLYNHVYHSDLPDAAIEDLLKGRRYQQIVTHQNFSPRVVEQMTRYFSIDLKGRDYVEVFALALKNPFEMWGEVLSQLSQHAQDMLVVLSGMSRETTMDALQNAVGSYRSQRLQQMGIPADSVRWMDAMKEIEGGFISTDFERATGSHTVRLRNPSLREFLAGRLTEDSVAMSIAVAAVEYIEQVVELVRLDAGRQLASRAQLQEAVRRCWGNSCAVTVYRGPSAWKIMDTIERQLGTKVAAELWPDVKEDVVKSLEVSAYSEPAGVVRYAVYRDDDSDDYKSSRADVHIQLRTVVERLIAADYFSERFVEAAIFVAEMQDAQPDFVSDSEWADIENVLRTSIWELANDILSDNEDDADWLRHYADLLNKLEYYFDVDTTAEVELLNDRAFELENPEEDEQEHFETDDEPADDPWDTIHGMFDGLKAELGEHVE